MPILLVEPDPAWPGAYERARDELLAALGHDRFLGFEHIGSTSVALLAAKPLIDMMAAVGDLDEVAPMIEPIEALGYTYLEEFTRALPGRHLFERAGSGDEPTTHLHIVVYGGENWVRHLGFRDWLRTHPQDRDAYASLKRELAARYDDTKEYSEAKTKFIRQIEAQAARASARVEG